jgi:hypothetical protein
VGHLRDELACIEESSGETKSGRKSGMRRPSKACKLCLNENGPDRTYEKRHTRLKEG